MNAVIELEEAYNRYKDDPEFNRELSELLDGYAGRPSRLYYAAHMTRGSRAAPRYISRREDLNHTGSHKINNVLGQVLLRKEDGQDESHRGDRRRTARRGNSNGSGPVWAWSARSSWERKTRSVRR